MGENVTDETIQLALPVQSLLERVHDLLVALYQHLQLSGDQEPKVPGCHHVLECRQEDSQDRVKVVNVLGLCGEDLVDDHVATP